jgi:hypothetical protein
VGREKERDRRKAKSRQAPFPIFTSKIRSKKEKKRRTEVAIFGVF